MSFLETVEKARAFLERNRRVSLSALRLEFGHQACNNQARSRGVPHQGVVTGWLPERCRAVTRRMK